MDNDLNGRKKKKAITPNARWHEAKETPNQMPAEHLGRIVVKGPKLWNTRRLNL